MIKSTAALWLARWVAKQQKVWTAKGIESQQTIFQSLIKKAQNTVFGKDHHFSDIKTYDDFKKHVPIRDYEQLSPYVSQIFEGKNDVLWPGKPLYFAKTSGTTSGTKYIPLTKDSIPNHINSARDALLCYANEKNSAQFFDRNLIFLSGSPELEQKNGFNLGRLSGIVNHHVPAVLRRNQKPSYSTNCIEDWETKLDAIVEETLQADMSLISGIPPWVQMYFDRLQAKTGKKIKDIFPNFNLFVYGGVNFTPYRDKIFESIGKKIDSIQTFPASEGFFAYQNTQEDPSLLLLLNSGIFFEFIPADEYFNENPTRLSIQDVKLGVNYALIINNNAGLWGYSIGDTIKFVSLKPYKIIFSGRIKHFTSAFGEHVIAEEVESALKTALAKFPETKVIEFSVAPQVNPKEGLPYHEWLMAFDAQPQDSAAFAALLDQTLRGLNAYYDDLISGSILKPLVIKALKKDAFREYMKSLGKLGGQNKVPRLSNDRQIADQLYKWAD
ncbi:MAG: hypothetical protein EAZ57_03470 [Cytophagales bacterium]|nr:MAG: hypothetical protein EAZ67_03935 [Cytophagales bacterium]TAF61522.1 MAG: hypothetical protein EAZ57_03470 [Cytophagales bacterium]